MATKKTIKKTFYDDLTSAVSGLVNSENVVLQNPEKAEALPAVAYSEYTTSTPYAGSSSVSKRGEETDSDGNTVEIYHEYMLASFDVIIQADDESTKDDIYEAVRSQYNSYSMWDEPDDFHTHCKEVRVLGGSNADRVDNDEVIRGDQLTVEFIFYRVERNTL